MTIMENEIETSRPTTHCLNCGLDYEGKFCPECGQSAETGRFTMRFIFENLLAAFISKDGGVWYTVKNLFTRPGAMIVEILNGKRRRYFSPFPMLLCVLTIYILLYSFTGSRDSFREAEKRCLEVEQIDEVESVVPGEIDGSTLGSFMKKAVGICFRIYNNHYTAVYMLTLPVFLFATRICFGKSNRKRYYRAEYLIAITYSMVMVVLYRCLVSLMFLFSERVSGNMGDLMPFAIAVAFTVCLRKMMGFGIVKTVWRSLLTVVLYFSVLVIIAFVGIILFGAFFIYMYQ